MYDRETVNYFNCNTCEYSLERMDHVVRILQETARTGDSLVDIGCGTGNTIEMLARLTPIRDFTGIDPSVNYLNLTRERNRCQTILGSILDRKLAESLRDHFDYALLGAVLHHLVGRTRRQSRRYAVQAVENALVLLKPGGTLFIAEPSYGPSLAMDALFYLKKLLSLVTSERISVGTYWQNIGAPVVSYYTNARLAAMVRAVSGAELLDCYINERRYPVFPTNLLRRSNTTLVVRKLPAE
ncbi:MAG: class I SAM-dependent methyltransferase [Candidatus Latescibacterota bacterium]